MSRTFIDSLNLDPSRITDVTAGRGCPPAVPIVRRRKPPTKRLDGFDSQWEAKYAERLQVLVLAAKIQRFYYHAIKLNVEGSWYTPDFLVIGNDGYFVCHEVKGFWRSRDRRIWNQVRHKYAQEFKFRVAHLERGVWHVDDDWIGPQRQRSAGVIESVGTVARCISPISAPRVP